MVCHDLLGLDILIQKAVFQRSKTANADEVTFQYLWSGSFDKFRSLLHLISRFISPFCDGERSILFCRIGDVRPSKERGQIGSPIELRDIPTVWFGDSTYIIIQHIVKLQFKPVFKTINLTLMSSEFGFCSQPNLAQARKIGTESVQQEQSKQGFSFCLYIFCTTSVGKIKRG